MILWYIVSPIIPDQYYCIEDYNSCVLWYCDILYLWYYGIMVLWSLIQPASEASGLAEGQRARFAREAATRFYPPPTPSGAVGHNPKSGSGQFLGRTSLEMRFTRVGVKSKIGHTTRVDAYVCLALHAGRVKRVKCVKRAILGKIRE